MQTHIAAALVAGSLVVLSGASAMAQTTSGRTFVSGLGNDTGTCMRAAPCRSFAYAIGMTPAGGEIVALDPADYGLVTITKAISLIGPGPGLAQITVPSGGTGVQINAGSGDTVILSNLEIDGNGLGKYGISANTAGSVQVIDSTVTGMAQTGIIIRSTTASVTRSLVANNGSVNISANATGSTLLTSDVIIGAAFGIFSNQSGSTVFVTDCMVSGSSLYGVEVLNGATGFMKRSVVTGARYEGLLVGSSTVYLDTTTITANDTGVNNLGGTVNSYGNNNIAANRTDTSGSAITRVSPN